MKSQTRQSAVSTLKLIWITIQA